MTPEEFGALQDTVFVGSLAQFAGSLAFHDDPESITASALGDRDTFDALLTRFGQDYPDADRRAVASFWSQHYFARLTIALTAFCLAAPRPLALELTALQVRFCPAKGTPLCFHLRCGGATRSSHALVKAIYDEQVAGTVAAVKQHTGLSARLLWENAGCYGIWALGEIARSQPSLAQAANLLLHDASWPRAACAMLPHLKHAARDNRNCTRRVCCLRYCLPGVARCLGTCPLADKDDVVRCPEP